MTHGIATGVPLVYYLALSAVVFGIGLVGIVINRRNLMILLVCIELVLLAANLNFVAFAKHFGSLSGEIFVFFVLAVAAVESAVGLAIIVLLFRHRRTIEVDELNQLKG